MFRVNKSRKIKIEKSIEPSYDIVIDNEQMRKEQKEAVYRKQEAIDTAINWIVGLIIFTLAAGLASLVIYYVGKSQGRW